MSVRRRSPISVSLIAQLYCFNESHKLHLRIKVLLVLASMKKNSQLYLILEAELKCKNIPDEHVKPYLSTTRFTGITNSLLKIVGTSKDVRINNVSVPMIFYVTNDSMSYDCLLGRDFISSSLIKVKFDGSNVTIENNCVIDKELFVIDIDDTKDLVSNLNIGKDGFCH
ncbi:hypothetical protein QE152_g25575 [Popillia japonica]|uniref:Uncharacterized protein n=1 Tax=Popillia japonica TaxID=7064 RepID=A0AAW1K0T7_POPJA